MSSAASPDYPERRLCERCDRDLDDHELACAEVDDEPVMFWVCPTSIGRPVYESMGERIQ